MPAPRVKLRNVHFGYRTETPVLRGLNLELSAGEIVGLLGANGAGKTTTFRIIAGLLTPDEGTVEVDAIAVAADPRAVRQRTAFIPETPLLYELMSAEENLNLFGLLWGVPGPEAASRSETLLRECGLWQVRHQWVRGYSLGMKQKLAICAALLHRPTLIVMDEPFTGLDFTAAMWGRQQLRALADNGAAILFSSHVPELMEAIADSIAILDDGMVVERVPVATVRNCGGAVAYFTGCLNRPIERRLG